MRDVQGGNGAIAVFDTNSISGGIEDLAKGQMDSDQAVVGLGDEFARLVHMASEVSGGSGGAQERAGEPDRIDAAGAAARRGVGPAVQLWVAGAEGVPEPASAEHRE